MQNCYLPSEIAAAFIKQALEEMMWFWKTWIIENLWFHAITSLAGQQTCTQLLWEVSLSSPRITNLLHAFGSLLGAQSFGGRGRAPKNTIEDVTAQVCGACTSFAHLGLSTSMLFFKKRMFYQFTPRDPPTTTFQCTKHGTRSFSLGGQSSKEFRVHTFDRWAQNIGTGWNIPAKTCLSMDFLPLIPGL